MSQCQNGAPPMFLQYTNVTVTLDQKAFSRGISISIGSPPQQVSLKPSTADDNLYPVNIATCAPSFNDTCIGAYGGLFNASASTSFHQFSEGQWNGTNEPNPGSLSEIYFNDVLSFGNATAYGFPAFLDQPGYGGQGTLPLGWKSDFLRIAFAMGAVPSKAFAIWTGSRSIQHPVDGSLVIGGYDSTRYEGEPTTFPSNVNCTTCAVVTGLTYDTGAGSVSLFSNASETLQVSLNPYQKVLYLTPDMFANFANATSGVWDASLGNLIYPATSPPIGNLTVTLSNNYTTTISAEDFFAYPRGYDTQGQYEVTNNTILLAQIQPMNVTGYVYDWGIPYLTMNYLMVDYARSQFQMAPAIRTDFQSQGGGYLLEAVCDPALPVSTTSSSASTPTATAHPQTSSATPVNHGGSNNTGAIIGGVVGGVLGLILIVGILAFLFYRSRQRRKSPPPTEAVAPVVPPTDHEKGPYGGAPAERISQYTATSPTDVGAQELSSERKDGVASVNEWLSSHGSETAASKNMDRPFEMPAGRYADSE